MQTPQRSGTLSAAQGRGTRSLQDEDFLESARQHGVHLIATGGPGKEHVQEARRVVQIVLQ